MCRAFELMCRARNRLGCIIRDLANLRFKTCKDTQSVAFNPIVAPPHIINLYMFRFKLNCMYPKASFFENFQLFYKKLWKSCDIILYIKCDLMVEFHWKLKLESREIWIYAWTLDHHKHQIPIFNAQSRKYWKRANTSFYRYCMALLNRHITIFITFEGINIGGFVMYGHSFRHTKMDDTCSWHMGFQLCRYILYCNRGSSGIPIMSLVDSTTLQTQN